MSKTYWTQFNFNHQLKDLHCTFKYFGPLTPWELSALCNDTFDHWARNPFVPIPHFTCVQMFGPEADIRVLTAPSWQLSSDMASHRARLGCLRVDTFPKYLPHVATKDLNEIFSPFVSYTVMEKDFEKLEIRPVMTIYL